MLQTLTAVLLLSSVALVQAVPHQKRYFNSTDNPCQPWTVPVKDRCNYILTHIDVCHPQDGIVPYLQIHFCYLATSPWVSVSLLGVWIATIFVIMMTVSEKFFCPSLELLSDYLRLPPNVAGATLLSFGNGANDIFTQFAAASQGGEDALEMALSEPIGGGLFVSNLVFGIIILLSSTSKVQVKPSHFLKDVLFYLGGIIAVLLILLDSTVVVWEVAGLAAYYVLYVATTLYLTRNDEPVHADPAHHEQPPADVSDSDSVDSDWDLDYPDREELTTALLSRANSAPHLTPPIGARPLSPFSPPGSTFTVPGRYHPPGINLNSSNSAPQALLGAYPTPSSPTLDPSPNLPLLNLGTPTLKPHPSLTNSHPLPTTPSTPSYLASSPRPILIHRATPSPHSSLKCVTIQDTCTPSSDCLAASTPVSAYEDPASEDFEFSRTRSQGLESCSVRSRASSLLGANSWISTPRKWRRKWWQRLKMKGCTKRVVEDPFIALLSLTMPRVSTTGHPYWKGYAMVLPLLGPPMLAYGLGLTPYLPPVALFYGLFCGAMGTFLVWALYPAHGLLPPRLTMFFTVLAFVSAVAWLNNAASELVAACTALGNILGLSPALLGATILAWGNSMGDLVADVAMARDGYPSIAVTGAFASPLFQLLGGVCASLFHPASQGALHLSIPTSLKAMYAFGATCLLIHTALATLCKFHLPRWMGIIAVALYAFAQASYVYMIYH